MHGDILIEAYDKEGKQILGNGDGQALLRGFKDYKRSNAYKRVKSLSRHDLSLDGRVAFYLVKNGQGELLEEIVK